jgi:hypothetical protein
MIRAAALSALLVFSAGTPAAAEESECAIIGDIAATVMRLRQAEHPISALMVWAAEDGLMRAIVLDAYNQPGYVTPEAQQRAEAQFANRVVRACYASGLTQRDDAE